MKAQSCGAIGSVITWLLALRAFRSLAVLLWSSLFEGLWYHSSKKHYLLEVRSSAICLLAAMR